MGRAFLFCIGLIGFILWAGYRIAYGIEFDQGIENYISQAASSPNPAVAIERLDIAIKEIQTRHLTSGNTGVFFTYPNNDVGFWYQRLVDSRKILSDLPKSDSQLEISNTMMRVHESLTGSNKEGTYIRSPDGISIHPYNTGFFWWCTLSLIFMVIGFFTFILLND